MAKRTRSNIQDQIDSLSTAFDGDHGDSASVDLGGSERKGHRCTGGIVEPKIQAVPDDRGPVERHSGEARTLHRKVEAADRRRRFALERSRERPAEEKQRQQRRAIETQVAVSAGSTSASLVKTNRRYPHARTINATPRPRSDSTRAKPPSSDVSNRNTLPMVNKSTASEA